ncbi:MAG: UDP-N-acetylmuramoyl-L-alanyl-D-glutamate--2,6-diaminopimelate ligase [Myxococcota bacterium]|jgi:UDP-N-acetylmuramoyl-L-alanyl-D-glutamate--2,6-diaminopimelate ligase|nr:UDP-N-acetylmuramoyl-L-alanyl-D-glutamate--2,6-diaminopimelate ligase [Myxococcota bacterium]
MRLAALLAGVPAEHAPLRVVGDGADEVPIRGIAIDSRAVVPGDLFVALRGSAVDGHDHLAQAIDLGAAALVVERVPADLDLRGRPAVVVRDSRRSLAPLAARFFGDPSQELSLIGVTGTNGKTSTTFLLESILSAAGRRTGLIGTVEVRYASERLRAINTTPESLELQRLLRAMRTRGVDAVVMEVSSHALAIGRTDGCRFEAAAMTNVTQDHLDFHRTMEAYRDAKTRLFRELLRPGAGAVVNLDDPAAPEFLAAARDGGGRPICVARKPAPGVDVAIENAHVDLGGTRARLRLPGASLDVELPLLGDFNVENLLVAVGVCVALGIPHDAIARGVAGCPQVPGRVERVDAGLPGEPTVLVDYAHTPDAVDKLLRTVRPMARGRLITVFGCGGDRDRTKRAPMAEAVARWSDRAIATSDNPRSEDPAAILADVELGLTRMNRANLEALDATDAGYACVVDRRSAIRHALAIARADDAVVIAGKGHEDYQIVGRERLPFDDRVEARRALAQRAEKGPA